MPVSMYITVVKAICACIYVEIYFFLVPRLRFLGRSQEEKLLTLVVLGVSAQVTPRGQG